MGLPIQQRTTKEYGAAYTKTYLEDGQAIGPIEYYTETPKGTTEFVGLLGMDGRLIPCTRNADGNFEFEDADHQKQVIQSARNALTDEDGCIRAHQVVRTDYAQGQPGQQTILGTYPRINPNEVIDDRHLQQAIVEPAPAVLAVSTHGMLSAAQHRNQETPRTTGGTHAPLNRRNPAGPNGSGGR